MSSPPSSGAASRSAASNGSSGGAPPATARLELYAHGETEAGRAARLHVERLHAQRLSAAIELAVFDLDRSPLAAQSARILLTPVLILRGPKGERRCFGDFGDPELVCEALGLVAP